MKTRDIPKTITLRFLKKHFKSDDPVFDFWGKYFAINNTPLLEEFIKCCWEKMEPVDASFVVETIIKLFLNAKMNILYNILCNNIGIVGKKYNDWKQIDLSFIEFLTRRNNGNN